MTALLKHPVFRAASDLRLSVVLLLIICIGSAIGTFVESHYSSIGTSEIGRAAAYDLVYDAFWFNAALVVLFVNLLLNLVARLARGRQSLGFLLVHIGMLVILVGAGVTRWYGFEGYLHIREGESGNVVASAQTHVIAREGGVEAHYPVRLYDSGPQNRSETVALPGGEVTLGVDHYWIRFERRLVPGPGGVPMVKLSTRGDDGMQTVSVAEGDRESIGGVDVVFHRDGLPPAGDPGARFGRLRLRAGGETCSFDVMAEPGPLGECGGWRLEQLEFQSDFKVGGQSDPAGPLRNPMVKLQVTSPGGETAETMLFALHPEFGTMHDEADLLEQVDLVYEIASGGVDLARRDGAIVMRAPFAMTVSAMDGDGETQSVPANQPVPLQEGQVYAGEGGLQLVAADVELSMVEQPMLSRRPGAPAAARLFVEVDGERAEAVCVKSGAPQTVQVAGRTVQLAYGSIMRALPYELYLEDFVLETYPGSENPASYESHVLLNDPANGVEGQPVRIWMNNPLNYQGRKHFQSSYDRDRRGTVLSVNRDPGKMPTYIGYTIFSLGFVVLMGQILVRRNRGQTTAAALALLVAAALLPAPARAQQAGGGMPGTAGAAEPPHVNLPEDVREEAARLIVQDFRGRMKPLDTLARETAVKVTKKTTFEGRHPVDLFFGLVAHPQAWYNYPAIAVKNSGVKELLGVDDTVTHVSLASLLQGGGYSLQADVERAHRTSANQRNKTQQKLIGFDERVHILYGALQGHELRIFPMPDDPKHTWKELPDVLEALGEGDPRAAEFQAAGDALFGGLAEHDMARVRRGLELTHALQVKYGAEVMPSELQITSELYLNSGHPFAKSTLPYLGAFLVLIFAYFWGLFRRDGKPWSWRSPLFVVGMLLFVVGFGMHLYGFVLRWIASGRAPLSNGHESLLWVALAVALAGILFEARSRTAAAGALGSLLAAVVLGVSMMSAFDPAIGPLVPVLASYWLNIHVTVITASYGFIGLCALLGGLTLVLLIIAGVTKKTVGPAVAKLDRLNKDVMVVGVGLLAIGTLLGGVWANESWGRYWGWDPKETWSLVSILVYSLILHLRYIPRLSNAYVHAVGSFLGIWTIIMTYFGVNYLLVGLHSYAAGEATQIPTWVVVSFVAMVIVSIVAGIGWSEARPRGREKPA